MAVSDRHELPTSGNWKLRNAAAGHFGGLGPGGIRGPAADHGGTYSDCVGYAVTTSSSFSTTSRRKRQGG